MIRMALLGRLGSLGLCLVGTGLLSARAWAQEPLPAAPTPLTDRTLQRIDAIKLESQGLQRGINLARDTAARLNGGLGLYRPERCMYAGVSENPCLVSRASDGFVFRFQGGLPGWEQYQLPASVETEVRIAKDGRSVVEVIYNGPPRQLQEQN
jgi:hypothetical protein